jgi:hypothetical protein
MGLFLFATASRSSLGPTQPPIQWVSGAISQEVKRPGREADHSPPSSADVNMRKVYIYTSSVSLHGVVLSKVQGQLYIYPSIFLEGQPMSRPRFELR